MLGANFLTTNKLEVDFGSGVLYIDDNVGYCCEFRSNGVNFEASVIQRLNVASFLGLVSFDDCADASVDSCDGDSEGISYVPKFVIP